MLAILPTEVLEPGEDEFGLEDGLELPVEWYESELGRFVGGDGLPTDFGKPEKYGDDSCCGGSERENDWNERLGVTMDGEQIPAAI